MKWIFIFMFLSAIWWIDFEIELYKANKKLKVMKPKQCPKCHEYPFRTRGTDELFWVEHFCLVDKNYYCMQIQAWNKRS